MPCASGQRRSVGAGLGSSTTLDLAIAKTPDNGAIYPGTGLRARVARFLKTQAPCGAGDLLLVAFSGGPDSLALAIVLANLGEELCYRLHLAHLDHAFDPASSERADKARLLARELELPFTSERIDIGAARQAGESLEAAARRIRYDYLEHVADEEGARFVATGHHRDDQAETVLLRMLFGTGLAGLSGIQPRRGRWIRPLLQETRDDLATISRTRRLEGIDDPGNRDLHFPRNRIRHHLLPSLGEGSSSALAGLARTSALLRDRLEPWLLRSLAARKHGELITLDRGALTALPPPLFDLALAATHRLAGCFYPARVAARAELRRQLDQNGRVGCDCSDGWRWESRGPHELLFRPRPQSTPEFSYNLDVPGEVTLSEVQVSVRMSRWDGSTEAFDETANRVCFRLPPEGGHRVTIRNRRPGDRIRPAGHQRERLLKKILIDRKVPREHRDRLPLLCVGKRIVWVPGITIDERMRPSPDGEVWIAEVTKE